MKTTMIEYSIWTATFSPVTMYYGPRAKRSWCFILPLDALHEDAVEAAREYSRQFADGDTKYVGADVESISRVGNAVLMRDVAL